MGEDLEKLKTRLRELRSRARSDSNLSDDQLRQLFGLIQAFEASLEAYTSARGQTKAQVEVAEFERLRRKLTVIEAIESARNPSYFPEFAAALAEYPYALPTALFDPQGKEVVSIDLPNNLGRPQLQNERLDLALSILYPGSFTYRYFGMPIKIETGQWSQTFVAHLHMHRLSTEPIFTINRNGRTLGVFKPVVLRARPLNTRNPFICINCLSLSGADEGCFHSQQLLRPLRIPSSSPRVVHQEVARKEGGRKELRPPLNAMIEKVTYLSSLKVGEAVLGFERFASNRVTIVDYDPPIGMILETKGLSFSISVPEDFMTYLTEQRVIMRDVLVQLLGIWVSDQMTRHGLPSYHLEPILSGIISSLGLDRTDIDMDSIMQLFSAASWIPNAVQTTMDQGTIYFERFDVQQQKLLELYSDVSHRTLDWTTLRRQLKGALIHSMAHNLLIAGCVTSGCIPQDLKYIVGEDEVLIFDSADGGNGSSEMIFEFCSSGGPLDIGENEEESGRETIFKPKYLDDALADMLLPCQQGVAERVFHGGFSTPRYQEIQRRFKALENQKDSYSREYGLISELGVQNCFVSSIGYHVALARQLPEREADRLKEALGICVHGCPDCLVLGNKCNDGGFLERYHVSKVIVDEYFRFKTRNVSAQYDTDDKTIESVLTENNVIILTARIPRGTEGDGDKQQDRVSELIGRRIGDKYIKFAGFWLDNPLASDEIYYKAMLGLV